MFSSLALRLGVIPFVCLAGFSFSASAQPPRQPPSPVLLKRLAEAVDGHRTGQPVFVVATADSAVIVRGVVDTRRAADSLARLLGRLYDVYGPFVAPRDPASLQMFRGCVHDGHTSYMLPLCPPLPFFLISDVASLTLTARLKDGTTHEMAMAPSVDAIFLTLPAIDKFVVPYYARTIGFDSAAAMRARIAARLTVR